MKLFREMGEEIERLWNARDYSEDVFPAIAADALRRAGLPGKISPWDVIEWTLAEPMLPDQKDLRGNFGDPPITVFGAPRFYIDVYFWFQGTTAIHQHGFCGAFQVFQGSSIHSWYDFEPLTVINAFTEIGDIRLKACELFNVGDVQEILPGRQYIHALFHLDQPSVTIVVRTYKIDKSLPQFSYYKPNLAVDPFYEVPTTIKKNQAVYALLKANHGDADRLISDLLEKSDFQTTFDILLRLRSRLNSDELRERFGLEGGPDRFETFLAASRRRHGELSSVIEGVIEHNALMSDLVKRRGYVTDPEHRFFLALLMNIEGKDRIFELITQRFPDADPAGKILDWVYDLSNQRLAGPVSQNALGVPDFDDADLFMLEKMLAGETPERIRDSIKKDYSTEKAAGMLGSLPQRIAKINNASIFKPLFSGQIP